jgi:hypothetical protein
MSFFGVAMPDLDFFWKACRTHKPSKADGIHRAPSIAVEWRDDLHDADATETLQRLGRRVYVALLRHIERVSDLGFDLRREGFEIFQRRTDPSDRVQLSHCPLYYYTYICISVKTMGGSLWFRRALQLKGDKHIIRRHSWMAMRMANYIDALFNAELNHHWYLINVASNNPSPFPTWQS